MKIFISALLIAFSLNTFAAESKATCGYFGDKDTLIEKIEIELTDRAIAISQDSRASVQVRWEFLNIAISDKDSTSSMNIPLSLFNKMDENDSGVGVIKYADGKNSHVVCYNHEINF